MPTIRFFCVICGTALEGATIHSAEWLSVIPARNLSPAVLANAPQRTVDACLLFRRKFSRGSEVFCTSCQDRLVRMRGWRPSCYLSSWGSDAVPRCPRLRVARTAETSPRAKGIGNRDRNLSAEEKLHFLSHPPTPRISVPSRQWSRPISAPVAMRCIPCRAGLDQGSVFAGSLG